MRKTKLIALVFTVCALCFALVACGGPSKQSFVGTWSLDYSESDDEMKPVHSEEDMKNLRDVNLDIYLNLNEDGKALSMDMGIIREGTWEQNGSNAKVKFDNEEFEAKVEGDKMTYVFDGITSHLTKGDAKDPYATQEPDDEANAMVDENGLSIVMESGEKLDKETVIVDNENVKLTIDGKGVAANGDPGYNLKIENKTDNSITVWTPNPFKVGEKDVMVYLYTTVNRGKSTTAYMEFDTDQIGSRSADSLVDVSGEIQVDNNMGDILGTYQVSM